VLSLNIKNSVPSCVASSVMCMTLLDEKADESTLLSDWKKASLLDVCGYHFERSVKVSVTLMKSLFSKSLYSKDFT
jgi:hypothetical protein